MLDVLVFGEELTGSSGEIAHLAAHRIAPLQVATSAQHEETSGLTTIDLFVAGVEGAAETLPAQFGERLGLLSGPQRSFERLEPIQTTDTPPTRSALGLPETGALFVSAADWPDVSPERQHLWARVLQASPGSHLLLQRVAGENADSAETERFAAAFDRVLSEYDVAVDRLILSAAALPNDAELQRLIALADVYLDVRSAADDSFALLALQAGVPVVTLEGATLRARRVASLLRSLDLDGFIAVGAGDYVKLAASLANVSTEPAVLRADLQQRAQALPRVLDALATAHAFGDLIELAYDELLSVGPARFRLHGQPLVVKAGTDDAALHVERGTAALANGDYAFARLEAVQALRIEPAHGPARALLGRTALAAGDAARAVTYLLPSVEAADADAARWFDLSRALQENGQHEASMQALEASLRLDATRAESWLMLIDLAEKAGALDLARDALKALRENAPNHPEISALSVRLGG
jgi:tetratricopeptide (TPR) repeat protein